MTVSVFGLFILLRFGTLGKIGLWLAFESFIDLFGILNVLVDDFALGIVMYWDAVDNWSFFSELHVWMGIDSSNCLAPKCRYYFSIITI